MTGRLAFILSLVALSFSCGSGWSAIEGQGGGTASGVGTAAGGGTGTGGGTGVQVVGGCPRVLLGATLPAQFSGDTTSLPNLVTSNRLEWTDAPDDAIEFTAPSAGEYLITLTSQSGVLGASANDYNTNGSDRFPFTRGACPASGQVAAINGVFDSNSPDDPISLSAGQKMVIFISAPYWAMNLASPYSLTVSKKP